jgi:hypothetical protein
MDFIDGEPCDQCGSTNFAFENAIKICENGHDQGVRHFRIQSWDNHDLDKPTLADSTSRRAKSLARMKTTGELRAGLCGKK